MSIVSLIGNILYFLLLAYFIAMWARFALDLARTFARQWRPRGAMLVIAEAVFTVTDPPIKALRKLLPPVRLGQVALDFSWTVVMLGVMLLMSLASTLARVA